MWLALGPEASGGFVTQDSKVHRINNPVVIDQHYRESIEASRAIGGHWQ